MKRVSGNESKNQTFADQKTAKRMDLRVKSILAFFLIFVIFGHYQTFKLKQKIQELEEKVVKMFVPHTRYPKIMMAGNVPMHSVHRQFKFDEFGIRYLNNITFSDEALGLLDSLDIYQSDHFKENKKFFEEIIPKCLELWKRNELSVSIMWDSSSNDFNLVATQDFEPGQLVGMFAGQVYIFDSNNITNSEFLWPYQVENSVNLILDGKSAGNEFRFLQHDKKENVSPVFIPIYNRWYLFFIAEDLITQGEFLYTDKSKFDSSEDFEDYDDQSEL